MVITKKQKMKHNTIKWRNVMKKEDVGSDVWNYCKFSIEHEHKLFRKRNKVLVE